MLDTIQIPIEQIYVPVKRWRDLDPANVESLAESILEEGQKTPIGVRKDGKRYVLVTGLHRLEACKSLGESSIDAILVGARQY